MTSRQTYTSGDRSYVVSLDARLRAGRVTQAIVLAQFQDEHTGASVVTEVSARTMFPHLTPRSTSEGLAGLTGIPERAIPMLRTAPYDVPFIVNARRYVPFVKAVHFDPQNLFPDSFTPRDLGVIQLHRESVELVGRVVRTTAAGPVPVSNATVSITAYWLRIPSAPVIPPADAPNLVSLQAGMYLNRSAGTAWIRRRDFVITSDTSELLDDAPAGVGSIRLSNRLGLASGEIVRIDAGDLGRTEFLIVKSVAGSSDATQPAQIAVQYPGRVHHHSGATAERVTLAAPGPDNALVSDAIPGDATVLSAALNGIAGAATIEIHDGSPEPEYHGVALFSTTTDAGGFYRLPALNRVGQLELTADDGVNPPVRRIVVPNYDLAQNLLDVVLN
jgi:hypothetical protein